MLNAQFSDCKPIRHCTFASLSAVSEKLSKLPVLTYNDFAIMRDLAALLEPVSHAIITVESDSCVVTKVFPLLFIIGKCITECVPTTQTGALFKVKLKEMICGDDALSGFSGMDFLRKSSFFDPANDRQTLISKFPSLFDDLKKEFNQLLPTPKSNGRSKSDSQKKGIMFFVDQEEEGTIGEWEKYLALSKVISFAENPLVWWKTNGNCFPNLYSLSKRYLCVPPTSLAVERTFKTAKLVCAFRRSSIKPVTFRLNVYTF